MSNIIKEVRHKLECGQDLFRRSTIEKILAEYDRLLMRNVTLEKNAVEHPVQRTGLTAPDHEHDFSNSFYCSVCGEALF